MEAAAMAEVVVAPHKEPNIVMMIKALFPKSLKSRRQSTSLGSATHFCSSLFKTSGLNTR
jgi:hypothetical protein